MTYTYSTTTQYVNDLGEPVSVELVQAGAPVTVEYIRDGEHLRASRVIVHDNAGTVAAPRPFVPEGSASSPAKPNSKR